jgi:hypothetical protein
VASSPTDFFAWWNELTKAGAYGSYGVLLWGLKQSWWYMASHVKLQDARYEEMKADRDYHRKAVEETRNRFDRAMDAMERTKELTDRVLEMAARQENKGGRR